MNGASIIVGATGGLGPLVIKVLKENSQKMRIIVRYKTKA